MSINGVGSYHAQNYTVQKHRAGRGSSVSDFGFMGNATAPSESSGNGKAIGLTTVGNKGYIAMYALMSYMDDKGLTNNRGMKSFNKMTAYSSQAEYNGFCSGIYDENTAWSMQRDWIGILGNAKSTFFGNPQTYKQGLECEKIIENLKKWSESAYQTESVDSTDVVSKLFDTGSSEIKVSDFKEYETPNYKVVPCNDGAYSYFNIYKNGESAGAFFYSDICIKRDSITGTEVLLSEHGTGAGMYNVIPMDEELKQALKGAMSVDELPVEELTGYSIKTHQGMGIQYVVKNGAEGRGGTPLLRSQRDIEKYNELFPIMIIMIIRKIGQQSLMMQHGICCMNG